MLRSRFKEMVVNSHRGRRFLLSRPSWIGLALVVIPLFAAPVAGMTRRAAIDAETVAAISNRSTLFLEVLPRRGDGWLALARRYCGSAEPAARLAAANGDKRSLLAGQRYRVPFVELSPDYQLEVVRALFKNDFVSAAGWHHRVDGAADGESLWHLAEWFTGRGENYRLIRARNSMADDDLRPDQTILVPARLLRPALRAALPPESPYYLDYGRDQTGEYAIYRLKAGEALYSSVVVRFTGRIYAEDVNQLAAAIAERNDIGDVTDIPVGYAVKIPFDLLLPEFLPAGHPQRREYEAGLLASAQYSNPVTARSLQGITVILDAGHGGSDVGASFGSVWESVYVYDIVLRIKELLERTTAARVETTTRNGSGFEPQDRDVLPPSRGHQVLTQPPYDIEDSTVGLHLRWYLANSLLRRVVSGSGNSRTVVFLSIHADSLHRSLRGAMAYIPGARYRSGSFAKSGPQYARHAEVRESPRVSFSQRDREESEGLSRQLATFLLSAFEASDLAVHPDKPIREKVIRHRREWVPAVLRYNAVPAKVLLEVGNLANEEDRRLIRTREFRQRVAEAVVAGLIGYYDDGAPAGVRIAAGGHE